MSSPSRVISRSSTFGGCENRGPTRQRVDSNINIQRNISNSKSFRFQSRSTAHDASAPTASPSSSSSLSSSLHVPSASERLATAVAHSINCGSNTPSPSDPAHAPSRPSQSVSTPLVGEHKEYSRLLSEIDILEEALETERQKAAWTAAQLGEARASKQQETDRHDEVEARQEQLRALMLAQHRTHNVSPFPRRRTRADERFWSEMATEKVLAVPRHEPTISARPSSDSSEVTQLRQRLKETEHTLRQKTAHCVRLEDENKRLSAQLATVRKWEREADKHERELMGAVQRIHYLMHKNSETEETLTREREYSHKLERRLIELDDHLKSTTRKHSHKVDPLTSHTNSVTDPTQPLTSRSDSLTDATQSQLTHSHFLTHSVCDSDLPATHAHTPTRHALSLSSNSFQSQVNHLTSNVYSTK